MTLAQLRLKHPRLIYRSFTVTRQQDAVVITFDFVLEPDIVFHPRVTIPYVGEFDEKAFTPYAFHIGLVEAISYWKCACPPQFVVEAGPLSTSQIRFWQDLYIHGLGEFYYRNNIDFTQKDFLKITNRSNTSDITHKSNASLQDSGDLVLVGGGKDSAVTLGLLKDSAIPFHTMVLNPTDASLANIHAAGLDKPIVISRRIDPVLLALNGNGYLNGHTPFSAYLAFLGTAVAFLYGNNRVVVSNERSANEGNVVYHGVEINHQYSKSFRFEELFREYTDSEYFSFLRPLNDVQISKVFAGFPEFITTFRSCNVGSGTNSWCGACAKCAFTYLCLSPWVSFEQMKISFGSDLFRSSDILRWIRELVGLGEVKPFDCVGTVDESILSLYLSIKRCIQEHREVPEGLLTIKSELGKTDAEISLLKTSVIERWGDRYNLPEDYLALLRQVWERAKT